MNILDALDTYNQHVPVFLIGIIAAVILIVSIRFAREAYAYLRASPAQRLRIRHAWRIGRQWRKAAPNLGLARVDQNTKGVTDWKGQKKTAINVIPRLKAFPEPWGIRAIVKTIPKVGIEEFEKSAMWIADAWGCQTVECTRLKAGLIEVRGLVGNPLDEHFPYEFPQENWALSLGRNPWGEMVTIPLKDLSGIKVAGVPGFGKTMLQLGWLATFAGRIEVQYAVFDGKTSDPRYGDWGEVGERAMFIVGDNPETANQRLTELVRMLKDRPERLVAERGTHKFWKHGPTAENPLVMVVMDECHNYIDSSGLRGADKELIEANQRMMRTLAKEGRGLGLLLVVATQKQTGDAIPTAVRDNLGVGICFAVFTIDAAEAALGKGIRDDDANDPTELNDPQRFTGVCVATGVPGLGGRYARVRVGDIDEDSLTNYVRSTVQLRRNLIPAAGPAVRDAAAGTESAGPVPMQKKTRRRKSA